jgi:hypothetical protein
MLGKLTLAVFSQCLPAISLVVIRCGLWGTVALEIFGRMNLLAVRRGMAAQTERLVPADLAQRGV